MRKLWNRLSTWPRRRRIRRHLDILADLLTQHYGHEFAVTIKNEWLRCYSELKSLEQTYKD